ncbi:hypothetical protein Hanom_Chr03g00278021 [Helianthus anomalus]
MSQFFTARPHACDPSSLQQYLPSKEIDAEMKENGAKRQREAIVNCQSLTRKLGDQKEPVQCQLMMSILM